ncbi:MAG: ATP-binding cassette domain-containing protein, partial [Actinomycetota bacterium]|nr:ATP-binding cassette domain-containing protein [Actinomycetota bacterium]
MVARDPAGPALAVRDLDVSYGRVRVCSGVELSVPEGSVCALVGTNGAGKSTVLRAIAGLIPADRGSAQLFGAEMMGLRSEQRARRGLLLAPGGAGTFPSLTVEETVQVGAWCQRKDRARAASAFDEVATLFPSLGRRRHQRAGTLSSGEQQLLLLGRALVARPRMLLIDELTLGLSPAVADTVVAAVAQLPARGTTVLVVEQSISRALELCQWVWFLERGEVRFAGRAGELAGRADLLRPVLLAHD